MWEANDQEREERKKVPSIPVTPFWFAHFVRDSMSDEERSPRRVSYGEGKRRRGAERRWWASLL